MNRVRISPMNNLTNNHIKYNCSSKTNNANFVNSKTIVTNSMSNRIKNRIIVLNDKLIEQEKKK